jgi:hypothetical protein
MVLLEKYRKAIIWTMMAFSFIALLKIRLVSPGIEGGQDSWLHYLISRYSWDYPHLLLNQWGKPVFTLLASPFCQFGFTGLVVFNILCSLFAGFFAYKACKEFKLKWPELAFILVSFSPIFLKNSISGLTEPLNALLVSLMLYLFARKKETPAYVIASFLPFVRSEGFIILGAVFLYLIIKKDYKKIPYILSGTLFYAILGAIISGNIMWVIDDNPYIKFEKEGVFDPGHGSLKHYINSGKNIWTFPLYIVAMISGLLYGWKWIVNKSSHKYQNIFFLSFGIFMAYLAAHSFIWYAGMMGSHGLIRVFVVTIPCFAILVTVLIDSLISTEMLRRIALPIIVGVSFFAIYSSYKVNQYSWPWQLDKYSIRAGWGTANMEKAYKWIQDHNYDDRFIVHMMPELNVHMNKDPYMDPLNSNSETGYLWSLDLHDTWMRDSHIIVWDGLHSIREGNMPLDSVMQSPDYKHLIWFRDSTIPEDIRERFDIHLFEKTE